MDFSKRYLMYETNSKSEYVDYGEIVSIINDKLVNVNMGGQRDTNGQLVILEAVTVEGDYVAQVGDWVGIEWRSGIPVAIGGGNSNSAGLRNINDSVKIVSQTDMASGVINSNHIRTESIEARHIKAGAIEAQHISANTIVAQHISANTIDSTHIKAGAIQAQHISANVINSNHIQANSISGGHIIGDSIESKHLTISTREFGLLAQYFTHSGGANKFEALKATRIEPVIDFDWGAGSPSLVGQNDNFGIRFQGMIFAPEAGQYEFWLTADNGAKLWINDVVVIDGWNSGGTAVQGSITLTRDTWSVIRLDYYDNLLNAKLKLEWKTPSGVRQLIPSRFLTSTQTVIDGGTILTNTITAANMKVGTITAASGVIADAAIGSAHIISGSILSAHIANAQIKAAHIASASIGSAHIASASIGNAHIVSLDAGKINAGFIASERIAANSISGNQIAANSIHGDRIIGNTIDANRIKAGSITSVQIGANTITANEIQAGAIDGEKIRAQSITADHISARGIDVANSIMIYNSRTGETLIGGGYLRVEGLDVGVIQSDNLLGNGLFLTASSQYGLLKNNPVGESILGANINDVGAHQIWKYDLATGAFITAINVEGKKPIGVAVDGIDKYLYTTVQGDNTLVQIDVENDFIIEDKTMKMGSGMGPAEIKYFGVGLMDHKHFFILNNDEHDHHVPDTLIVVDAPPFSVNSELYLHHEIVLGSTPYDMVLDSNKWLYITQSGQGDIAVLDMSSHDSTYWKVVKNIPIGAHGTDNYHGGLPTTIGFGEVVGGDAAAQYDSAGGQQAAQGDSGGGHNHGGSHGGSAHVHGGYGASTGTAKSYKPKGIAQSADIDTLYVVDADNNELVVVDKHGKAPYNNLTGIDSSSGNMGDHEHTEGMPMPPMPETNDSASPASARFYAGGGPRTRHVRYRITVGDNPDRVEVMNGKIFVTLQGSGQVAIIDEADILEQIALDRAWYQVWNEFMEMRDVPEFDVRHVTVGSRPTKMLPVPAIGKLLISLTGQNRVAYFDVATETVTNTINTGSNPIGLTATNDGRFLYVANNGSGGDLSFIYPAGPFIGDPYIGLEGMVEYQGADFWTPYRTDWVKDASGNIIASSAIEFRVNEPFLNEGGYAAIRLQGKRFQEAWIEQDIYNVENYSNGNNVINTLAEKLYNISGNQSKWYSQADFLTSPAPVFRRVQEVSGNVTKFLIPSNQYTVDFTSPSSVTFTTPIPSGNWVEADYTTRNNLYYKPHNGSVLIAQENSSTENFKTEFHLEEFVPKFVVFDNQQTSNFTPTADGINEEYLGLEYSVMTNRAKGKPVTASATPTAGSLSLVSDGLQVDDMMGDHTMMDMFPNQPFVTLPSGLQHVRIDLQGVYMIGKITVSHAYEIAEDRKYQATKTEVSEDGITWHTVFDSAVSGVYSEKPFYHEMHGHTHYTKVITFPARPVRYVRDWANGYMVGTTFYPANHWTDIKVFGDWELETGYVYPSGEQQGQQIATNGKGIVTTDIPKAFIAADIQIEFTSWWYMTYVVGPGFGTVAIEMPTIMNSNHTLSMTNDYVNKIAHRHIMSFPPSTMVQANEAAGIKAGKHRAVIRQESGKVSLDRLRFEDFQFYKTNPLLINGATTTFQRYKIVAEQSRWYQGQGRQSTFGPYDTPRTNPDTGLPDNSVPIKYRFRVKSYLNSDNINEERGVAYITSAIVETGKQSTHWRPSAASDSIAASKLEAWDGNQPHKTGIQSHHIANGAIRGTKILPHAIMDYHISPYARIEESKLRLKYPTHGHGKWVPNPDPLAPYPFILVSNKDFLDTLEGWGGSGGVYGVSNNVARADHEHDYVGVSGTAYDSTRLGGLVASAYLRSNTSGTLTGSLTITSALNVTGNAIIRGTAQVMGATTLANVTVNGNIAVTGTVDGVDVSTLNTNVVGHIGSGGSAHALATAASHGFLHANDFTKLSGIQSNAINQTTADGRYVLQSGGTVKALVVNNVEQHPLTLRRGLGTTEQVAYTITDSTFATNYTNDETNSHIQWNVINTDTETGGGANANSGYVRISQTQIEGTNLYVNSNVVWHSGNFVPANYYTKTQTDALLIAAGDIRAGQANTFNHAGLAIKVQPSANVAGTQKLLQVNNFTGTELISLNHNGDFVIKNNLIVEGETQYAGTTVINGDYTVLGDMNVSGNTVLNTATIKELTIPANGVIKQIGKEVEVMRFPIFGVAGDMQFQTDSTTAYEKIVTQYNLFNTSYAMPTVPTGATRKYRFLISYSTSTTNNCTFRVVQSGTTTVVMTENLIYVNGAVDGTSRTILTNAFTTTFTGHVDLQAISSIAGHLVIKYVEVIAYDVY